MFFNAYVLNINVTANPIVTGNMRVVPKKHWLQKYEKILKKYFLVADNNSDWIMIIE